MARRGRGRRMGREDIARALRREAPGRFAWAAGVLDVEALRKLLGELARRGFVASAGDTWRVTAAGHRAALDGAAFGRVRFAGTPARVAETIAAAKDYRAAARALGVLPARARRWASKLRAQGFNATPHGAAPKRATT